MSDKAWASCGSQARTRCSGIVPGQGADLLPVMSRSGEPRKAFYFVEIQKRNWGIFVDVCERVFVNVLQISISTGVGQFHLKLERRSRCCRFVGGLGRHLSSQFHRFTTRTLDDLGSVAAVAALAFPRSFLRLKHFGQRFCCRCRLTWSGIC